MIWERNRDAQACAVNYFNYFTEIEEHFQRARGTSLFLLSPLDWALIETWKNAGVPLEAVLRGIDAAFEKWRSRKSQDADGELAGLLRPGRADRSADHGRHGAARTSARRPRRRFRSTNCAPTSERNAAAMPAGLSGDRALAANNWPPKPKQHYADLEALEQRLTVLEEKMIAAAAHPADRRRTARRPPRTRPRSCAPTAAR